MSLPLLSYEELIIRVRPLLCDVTMLIRYL